MTNIQQQQSVNEGYEKLSEKYSLMATSSNNTANLMDKVARKQKEIDGMLRDNKRALHCSKKMSQMSKLKLKA